MISHRRSDMHKSNLIYIFVEERMCTRLNLFVRLNVPCEIFNIFRRSLMALNRITVSRNAISSKSVFFFLFFQEFSAIVQCRETHRKEGRCGREFSRMALCKLYTRAGRPLGSRVTRCELAPSTVGIIPLRCACLSVRYRIPNFKIGLSRPSRFLSVSRGIN